MLFLAFRITLHNLHCLLLVLLLVPRLMVISGVIMAVVRTGMRRRKPAVKMEMTRTKGIMTRMLKVTTIEDLDLETASRLLLKTQDRFRKLCRRRIGL
jgi:hypothetical protein